MTTHTKPTEQTRFARSGREVYGQHFPIPQRGADWPVAAACILGCAILLILGVTL
jgi:hypothetical protein